MKNFRTAAAVFAAFGSAGTVAAQLPVGAAAPALEIHEAYNDGPTSWSELTGKAILIKFTATW